MKFHLIFVFIFLAVDLSQAVTIPPKITKQGPKDIFYKPFETVKILCEAVGFPALTYKWMRADKDYTPQGNDDRVVQQTGVGTLIINSPEDKDEGLYQCLASNGHGTAATVKFNLKMAKLKEFATSDPIYHNNINLGEPLTLNCQSPDSVPDAQIYWAININGVIKPVSWNARVTMDYEDRLHFTHVTEEDRQNGHPYQCVAYNALMRKSVMGPPHYIQPQGTNPIMSPMKSAWPNNRFDEVGLLGTTHKLKCIYSGNPTPNVKWMRQGYDAEHLKTNPRVLTGNSGGQELVIKDLQFEDSGTYICQATKDQEPKPQEMSINLNINASPRWVAKPEDVTTSEETTAQISCLAEGVPKPKIEWFVNGEKLEDALRNDFRLDPRRFHKLEESRVVMEYLTIADSMVFQCNVSNIHGYLWGEAFLNVLNEPPTILVPPQAVLKVAEGQPFTMTCVVTGKPEATITWRKNDMQVTGGRFVVLEEGSLVVKVSTLADAGEYRCHAENKNGTAEASGVLVVRRKTVIEWKPRDIEVQRPTNAKFTCSGTTDPEEAENLETIWLKDTKPVELGTRMFKNIQDHSLTISGTEQEDTGTYTCVVTNGLDNATASARLVVTDVPDAPVWVAINNSCRAMPNQCFPPGNKSCQTQPVAEVVWMPGSFNNAPIQYFTVEYMTTQDPNHWVFAEQVDYIKAKAFIPLSPGMKYFFRVTSYNKIGASKPSQRSNDSCETSDKLPLYNPRNVRTIGDKPGKVHIEWTPVPPEHQGHMNFSYLVSYKRVGDPNSAWNKHQISDWKISDYIFSNTGTPYQAYLISVISTNSMGESADAVNVVTGHSDESIPLVWPTDLQTLDIQSDRVTFQWKFDHTQIGKVDSKLRGEFRGFKIQYWEENHIEETIRETDILPEQFVNITNDIFNGTVRNVFPNTRMQARVSVLNLFFVSKPSGVIDFVTPPGLPGPVQYMEDINIGDNHINLQWYTPLDNRDDIIGYDIGYREVDGLHMSEMQERNPQIDDPYTTSAMLSGLLPSTKYRIYIWARTAQGRGDEFYIERTTAAPGELRIPRFTISGIGHDFINVSWWRDAYIDSSSVVYVQYKKDDGAEWFSTSPDVSRDWVKVSFLEAGIWYNIRIVVTNGDSMRLSEQEDVLTDGEAKAYDVAANLGWFLALIFAILLQIALVIILIICYRKGHYFKTQQKQTRAYDSRENTYSDEAEIPRHSKEFGPEPGGFSNDYYWNGYDRDRDSQDGVYKDHFQGKGDYEYDDDRYHNPNYSDYPPYEYDNSEGGEPLQRGEKKRLSSFKNHNVYEDYGNEEEEGDVSYHKSDMSDNNSFPPPPSDLDSERGGRGHYEGLSSTEERRMESRGAQARNNRDTSDNRYSHDSPHDDRRTQHYHRRQEDSRRTHDHHHQHTEPHSDERQDGRSHPDDYDHHRNDYDHRRDRNRSRHDESRSYSGDEADDSHHHGHHSNHPGHDHEKCQEVVDEFKRYSGSEMSHEVGSVDSGRRKPPTDTFV